MNNLHVLVFTKEQLNIALNKPGDIVSRIYVDSTLATKVMKDSVLTKFDFKELFLACPYILRNKDKEPLKQLIMNNGFEGVLVRNLETLAYLNENLELWPCLQIVLDSSCYALNKNALDFYVKESKLVIKEFYSSFELTEKEILEDSSLVVYGRIPMMVSANCVRKTMDKCSGGPGFVELNDRTGAKHVVFTDCLHCYNVIFNAIPLSLHKYINNFDKTNFRLDFTNEPESITDDVINYFHSLFTSYKEPFYKDFTTGHIKRSVE